MINRSQKRNDWARSQELQQFFFSFFVRPLIVAWRWPGRPSVPLWFREVKQSLLDPARSRASSAEGLMSFSVAHARDSIPVDKRSQRADLSCRWPIRELHTYTAAHMEHSTSRWQEEDCVPNTPRLGQDQLAQVGSCCVGVLGLSVKWEVRVHGHSVSPLTDPFPTPTVRF